MSNDSNVREFLQRMAGEIDAAPLDSRSPAKRARRLRSFTTAVVVVIAVAVVAGGSIGLRSINGAGPRPANEPHPSMPLMHNGAIGVFGWMNGVRSLTPDGAGRYIYTCKHICSHVFADWSPDGARLALETTCGHNCTISGPPYNGIHVVDLLSGTDRRVVPGKRAGDPTWSPDGTRIAYVQGNRVFVMNEDGSGQTPITPELASSPSHLSWSPDGSRIVYVRDSDQLFVVGLDGAAPSPVGGFTNGGSTTGVQGRFPVWSPDGTRIAYFGAGSTGPCEVRETTPDGRHDVSLIDLAAVSKRCSFGGGLTWSPDGTKLAALVYEEVNPRHGYSAVFVVKAEGGAARSFTGWVAGWPWEGLTWRPVP